MDNPELILIGGGGHCSSVIDVIELENKYKIAGIVDENYLNFSKGYKALGKDDDLDFLFKRYKFALITIGHIESANRRKELYLKLTSIGYKLPKVISPRAYVSLSSNIAEGTIVMHGAIVNSSSNIGKNCIINSNALIEHDSIIEDHCHVSTGAIINGGCIIKEGSFIGSNSTIIHSSIVESNSFIKAGMVFFNKK